MDLAGKAGDSCTEDMGGMPLVLDADKSHGERPEAGCCVVAIQRGRFQKVVILYTAWSKWGGRAEAWVTFSQWGRCNGRVEMCHFGAVLGSCLKTESVKPYSLPGLRVPRAKSSGKNGWSVNWQICPREWRPEGFCRSWGQHLIIRDRSQGRIWGEPQMCEGS